jgi:cytochrome P450
LRPYAQQLADDLIDRMQLTGPPADIAADYAQPIPISVSCKLLGVPAGDGERVREWSFAFLSTSLMSPWRRRWCFARFGLYMSRQIAKRRRRHADDLLTALARALDEEAGFSRREMTVLGMTLIAAGHETAFTQLTNSMYVLLT